MVYIETLNKWKKEKIIESYMSLQNRFDSNIENNKKEIKTLQKELKFINKNYSNAQQEWKKQIFNLSQRLINWKTKYKILSEKLNKIKEEL